MAILQVVLDGGGQVVGVRKLPVDPVVEAANRVIGAYSYGATSGTSREASDHGYILLVEQSTKLTDQQKSGIETLIRARPVGDSLTTGSAPPGFDPATGDVFGVPSAVDAPPVVLPPLVARYVDP